jgi:hypothetical protein
MKDRTNFNRSKISGPLAKPDLTSFIVFTALLNTQSIEISLLPTLTIYAV